jgi:uncharacterized protein YecE (DUF72 family)
LGDRLGPILFQFPYFAKAKKVPCEAFIERLAPFLDALPSEGYRFALEIRNKARIGDDLLGLLLKHRVALAFIDHPYMPWPELLFRIKGILTAPFAYFRWLGDRYAIEKLAKRWNETIIGLVRSKPGSPISLSWPNG